MCSGLELEGQLLLLLLAQQLVQCGVAAIPLCALCRFLQRGARAH
jgi:hypothetical protein